MSSDNQRTFILRREGISDIDVTASVEHERAALREAERTIDELKAELQTLREECDCDTVAHVMQENEALRAALSDLYTYRPRKILRDFDGRTMGWRGYLSDHQMEDIIDPIEAAARNILEATK